MPPQQELELKRELSSVLVDQAIGIRQRRRVVEEQWLRAHRAWMNTELDRRFMSTDTSASNYNIPMGRRAFERTVVRGVKLLTPNVKWYEVLPVGEKASAKVGNVDSFMNYILRKRIRSRTNISQLVRSMLMYGRCHLKTSVTVRNNQVWPAQRVVDPFSFYIFPETASNIEEADVVFEDFLLSYEKYKTFVSKGIVEEVKTSDLGKPDWPYHLVERLAHQGITDPTADITYTRQKIGDSLDRTKAGFVSVTEMWLPKDEFLYQVYIVWNHKDGPQIVGFIQSEYDEPLYRSVIHRPIPNESYTNSMMDDIAELNVLANDQINKFQDAVDFEQGFTAINDQLVSRMDSIKAKGRSVWHLSDDPNQAIKMFQPPISSTNQLRAWQIYLGLMNSMSGTGTIAEGQPGRNMPRAGGAVNNLINLGMADIQDVSEVIEQEVLTLGLSDIYKVSTKFIPEQQLIKIPGGQGLFGSILKRDDILGDYEFEWVGSLQFQDEQQRAQRLMIFLNLAIQPQANQLLQQQGYAFNFVELVKTVWRYGLGERGLSDVVLPVQELQQQMQQMQQMQQTQPGMQQQQPQQPQQQGGMQPQQQASGVSGLNIPPPSIGNGFARR